MTRADYDKGIRQLVVFIPAFSVPDETLDAWYRSMAHMEAPVFWKCLGIIARKTKAWYTNCILPGMVFEVEMEARRQIREAVEEEQARLPARTPEQLEASRQFMKQLTAYLDGGPMPQIPLIEGRTK